MAHVTVMTGPQRRRRWSDAERVEILEAVFAPGAVVADVASQFDVATSLIYKWRRAEPAGRFTPGHGRRIAEQDGAAGWARRRHRGAPCRRRPGGDRRRRADDPGERDLQGAEAMIPIPAGVQVWIATGHTDMRKGMPGLALQVEEALKRDPNGGHLYVFRGRRGDLGKILWHDDLGMSLYAKRLKRGRFIWPAAAEGAIPISPAQMAYLLEGINWRNPQQSWRPQAAG